MSIRSYIDIVGLLNQPGTERLDEFSFRDMFRRNKQPAPQQPTASTPVAAPVPPAQAATPSATPPSASTAPSNRGPGNSMVMGLQYAVSKRDYKGLIQRLQLGKQTFPKYANWFSQNLNDIQATQWGEDWEKEQAWKKLANKVEGDRGADLLKALNSPGARQPR